MNTYVKVRQGPFWKEAYSFTSDISWKVVYFFTKKKATQELKTAVKKWGPLPKERNRNDLVQIPTQENFKV